MALHSVLRRVWAVVALAGMALAPSAAADDETSGFERTPPRLSLIEGEASFWRDGASDWAPARANLPLAGGDQLYTAPRSNLEVQVGPRAYLRVSEQSELGVIAVEPDFLQFSVSDGVASLDVRSISASQTIEVDTPNAAFTIERTGYYRVDVSGDSTTFITRRGGRAVVTVATGHSAAIEPSELVVVSGIDAPRFESYAAPQLDSWDRFNYARTDDLLDAVSARYVSTGVYGVADLDHYGDWRVVPTYGAVWVPRGIAVDWAPYSAGRWVYDPFYGWTWVDDAPWGWAPFHYGRWVRVASYWAWCPGPVVVRPYYAPALVAFFGSSGVSVGVSIGTPWLGWVALGWGEPIVPWWGPASFRSRPYWTGWRGPRVIDRGVVKGPKRIGLKDIHGYEHARDRRFIVTERRDDFGRRRDGPHRFERGDRHELEIRRGDLDVRPDRSSFVPALGSSPHPPRGEPRKVVATRPPRAEPPKVREPDRRPGAGERREVRQPVRVVEPPREGRRIVTEGRTPFGQRGDAERQPPPPPRRFDTQPRQQTEPRQQAQPRQRTGATQPDRAPQSAPEPRRAPARQAREPGARQLPGEAANRVWRPGERSVDTSRGTLPWLQGRSDGNARGGDASHRSNATRDPRRR